MTTTFDTGESRSPLPEGTPGHEPRARLQLREPRLFTLKTAAVLNAFGVVLFLPVLASLVVASMRPLGAGTVVIPLLTAAATLLFLPIGFGNPFVSSLVSRLGAGLPNPQASTAVQVAFAPRSRTGLRALLEDADDLGWIRIGEGALVFQGDSTELVLPRASVLGVETRNVGWRGLFVYGAATAIRVQGLPVEEVLFAERASWLINGSRRNARQLEALVRSWLAQG